MQVLVLSKRILLFLTAFVIYSCGTSVVQQSTEISQAGSVQSRPAAPAEDISTDLSPELFYKLMLAEIAGQRGQVGIAVKQYLAAARESRDPKIIERAARIAVYARDSKSALEAAQLWVDTQPESVEAHQVAAAMQLREGNAEQAQIHLEKVITLRQKGKHNAFMLITSLLSKERDKQMAMNVMEQLVANHQQNHEALYAYSQLGLLVGELDKALVAAEKVRNLKPDWVKAQILYSSILHRQGKKAKALAELKQSIEDHPDSVVLRDYYARRLVDEKKYAEARNQFQILLEDKPGNSEARYALALLTLQTRDYDVSESHFKRLYKGGKRVNESGYYLGQIAEQQEQTDAAIKWYTTVDVGHYQIEAQIRIALLESKKGLLAEARDRLRSINATTLELEQRLFLAEGEMLRDAKQHQAAFDLYSEGLAKMPDNTSLLYARALTAEKIERIDVTFSDLGKIIKTEPNNAQALNALGYTLVDRTKRLKEGLAYIERAYKLKPEDAAILDSMGWANYRMGRYAEALKHLRKAFVKLGDAEIAAHLGEVLWVMGDEDEARTVWDEATQATPSHQLLLDVIKRFTE